MLSEQFTKSSYSGNTGQCVEVASRGSVHVRDSKDVSLPGIAVSPAAWAAFIARVSQS